MHAAAAASRPEGRRRLRRRMAWVLLLATVLLLHAVVALWLDEALVGWGSANAPAVTRIDVAFVRELAPAAPPAMAARAATPRSPRERAKPVPPPEAASAPEVAQAPPEPASEPVEPEPPPVAAAASEPVVKAFAAAASVPAPEAPAPAAIPSAPSAAEIFEWPPSTRVTYKLSGNYRGEVHGNARVQWVREGSRYQVHLDVTIGPSFAPLVTRLTTSEGEVGAAGLVPRRYEEITKVVLRQPRRAGVQFADGRVTLADGTVRQALPGLQDAASQFVQMTWLFTTQPQQLRVGNSIVVPLALPRRMDHWTYDVTALQPLDTPLGTIDAFHLKPRRAAQRPRGELSAEIWFAPTLQYLPVRLRLEQDAETYVDLVLDSAPLQAAPGR